MNNSGGVSENPFEFCMVTGVLLIGSRCCVTDTKAAFIHSAKSLPVIVTPSEITVSGNCFFG